jgi:hypothetical protein
MHEIETIQDEIEEHNMLSDPEQIRDSISLICWSDLSYVWLHRRHVFTDQEWTTIAKVIDSCIALLATYPSGGTTKLTNSCSYDEPD